jgi:hypothetical protein
MMDATCDKRGTCIVAKRIRDGNVALRHRHGVSVLKACRKGGDNRAL